MSSSAVSRARGFQLNIRNRLILGFAAVCLILVAAVAVTIWRTGAVDTLQTRIVDLRVPTSFASQRMVNNINASLADLRGWMLTGNTKFKDQRAAVWQDIDLNTKEMDRLSQSWTNPANVKKWKDFTVVLGEFRTAQAQTEAVAHTIDEQPANKILFKDAAPRATVMLSEITKMIDIELTRPATPARKKLLGIMADVRGTTARSLASIRAFLLSGDQKFQDSFDTMWAKNIRRFGDLKGQTSLLTTAQKKSFNAFSEARAEFVPLPPQMFEIRHSNKWNMANYTLVSEAAPRAGKLLTTLLGDAAADGSRNGGMVANQKRLLSVDADTSAESISSLLTLLWILLPTGLGIAIAIVYFTSRSIVNPVNSMTDAMKSLADGNTSIEIPGVGNSDEIGDMASAVQVFKDNAIERERLEAEASENEKRMAEERKKAMAELADSFESSVKIVVEQVSKAAAELQTTAQSMSSNAEESTRQTTTVAAGTEETTANVETVASAAEELSSSINEISRQVTESSKIAANAVDEAKQTNEEMKGLADAAQKIGEVINLINDIASQTNLLALNATIEAARAGEAGKGFAVVASEVKNLANRTAKATEDITVQIGGIQDASSQAVGTIESIGSTIDQINNISSSIAGAVEEQSAATGEISRNVKDAADGTKEVSKNVGGIAEVSQATASAAEQVLGMAGELATHSENLSGEVENFLKGVREG